MREVLEALNPLVDAKVVEALAMDEQKTEYNQRAKASMDLYLRSKTWVEKVGSIERMNMAGKIAKEAMRKALARHRQKSHFRVRRHRIMFCELMVSSDPH